MRVRHLSLTDFRSYPTAEVDLEPGTTVLVGANGQGKTNLVEAIGYISTLSSHRVATDAPLVRTGAERATVRAAVVRDGRELLVEIEICPGRANRARLGRASVPRARDVLGALRTVLFAPEDLALVKGDPGERRRFLDELLVARAPRYAGVRVDYERVLRQRNALLKTAGGARRAGGAGDLRTLDVWDGHLARHGAELLAGRLDLVESLRPLVDKAYDAVSHGTGPATIDYRSSVGDGVDPTTDRDDLAALLLTELTRLRSQEVDRGISLVGPHRDDLQLSLGPSVARGFASHGESWSYALALRLASYDLLCSDGGEPVLILDDVFAELDTGRRERLAGLVGTAEQLLVTAAVPADVPAVLQGARFEVTGGQVRRAG
ncbi:MAG: DNA replication/repair protein RecF [Actinomycetota bacterium]|nr:DNA replication/repair protein RecF [Actinomycetota bacterium]